MGEVMTPAYFILVIQREGGETKVLKGKKDLLFVFVNKLASMSQYIIPDEISVILISTKKGRVLDE